MAMETPECASMNRPRDTRDNKLMTPKSHMCCVTFPSASSAHCKYTDCGNSYSSNLCIHSHLTSAESTVLTSGINAHSNGQLSILTVFKVIA